MKSSHKEVTFIVEFISHNFPVQEQFDNEKEARRFKEIYDGNLFKVLPDKNLELIVDEPN